MGLSVVLVFIAVILPASLVLNVVYFIKKRKPEPTHESLNILADLLNKQKVLVRLERVDPSAYFLRSPKE